MKTMNKQWKEMSEEKWKDMKTKNKVKRNDNIKFEK